MFADGSAPPPTSTFNATAFTAWAETATFNAGEVIRFSNVITNIGDDYSNLISRYTCPIDGVYVFHVTLTTEDGEPMQGDIMLDDTVLVTAQGGADHIVSGSNTAVIACNAGQQVWVEAKNDGDSMLGDNDNRFNAFSGFLVQPL